MKKTAFIFIYLILHSCTFLAQDLGKIIIRNASADYPKFIGSLNGIRFTNDYNSTFTFKMLDETTYKLKLLQAGSMSALTFTLSSEPKYVSKYIILKDNVGNYSVLLESKSLSFDEPEPPMGMPSTTTPTVPATPVATTVVVTQTVAATPTITAISSADFNERLGAVKKLSFDDERLAKAKQVFDDEYMTTNQVMEVVKLFSFDGARLDFSKWMYKRTVDKKNYYKIDDLLTFGSSKEDLNKFIKNQPK